MSFRRWIHRIAWVAMVLVGSHWSLAEDPSRNASRLRRAIEKSIPLLESSSATSAKERQCFTCHHQALPILALVEAKEGGFAIDEANLHEQLEHTYRHLRNGMEGYRSGRGQGGGVLTAGYALWALERGSWPADEVTEVVSHYLLETQTGQPHWRHRGSRPPSSGSDFTATYVASRGLSYFHSPTQADAWRERQARVAAWLRSSLAADTEDAVFRLRGLSLQPNTQAETQAAIEQLLGWQQADGGWGQTPGMPSDPYATASVLASLVGEGQLTVEHTTVTQALHFLLDTQGEDGTWHVTTRAQPFQEYYESGFPYAEDQFISIAATAWSTLALVRCLALDHKANSVGDQQLER
jgi:N-acyl-D-amino-acid deacylase